MRAGEERIPILTNAQGVPLRRHIVHVDDVMQAFSRMLGNASALGQTFNIAGPSAFDYRVAAEYLSEKTGEPVIELRCPDYHSFEINITRARTVLGYAPENDFFPHGGSGYREPPNDIKIQLPDSNFYPMSSVPPHRPTDRRKSARRILRRGYQSVGH